MRQWVKVGRVLRYQFGRPAAGEKMNDVIAKPCAVHFVSICYAILSFVASFAVFNILEFSLNWFFTLIAFDKNGNAVQKPTRVIFFFWPGKNELNHCKACVHEMTCFLDHSRLLICCFDSGPWLACLVRMRDDMLLLHIWDNNIYSVYEHH